MQTTETTLKNDWATPGWLHESLSLGSGRRHRRICITTKLQPNAPDIYSMYLEDKLFGANHDAYSCKWQGSSQANPAKDMEKAIGWAIFSATDTDEPVLTSCGACLGWNSIFKMDVPPTSPRSCDRKEG